MNERIRKIAAESGVTKMNQRSDGFYVVDETAFEKFAELIVKETMQVVANQLPSNQYLNVADVVIEHFGVEE